MCWLVLVFARIGAVLCWTTQEIAIAALQHADGGSPSDEAQQALASILAFENGLRMQSTLVLGIALQSVVADGDDRPVHNIQVKMALIH